MTPEEKNAHRRGLLSHSPFPLERGTRCRHNLHNAAIPTKDGAVIPAEYVAELICHLHELWKLDISMDDYDPCYECTGYGDDYRLEGDELVSNCDGCPHDKLKNRDDD